MPEISSPDLDGRVLSDVTTAATCVKASSGTVFGWAFYNTADYDVYVKFYDKASAPVESDTPLEVIQVSAAGSYEVSMPKGFTFNSGIAYAMTKRDTNEPVDADAVTGTLFTS